MDNFLQQRCVNKVMATGSWARTDDGVSVPTLEQSSIQQIEGETNTTTSHVRASSEQRLVNCHARFSKLKIRITNLLRRCAEQKKNRKASAEALQDGLWTSKSESTHLVKHVDLLGWKAFSFAWKPAREQQRFWGPFRRVTTSTTGLSSRACFPWLWADRSGDEGKRKNVVIDVVSWNKDGTSV